MHPHPGGFESECWVVDDIWFVKVWRSTEPPSGLGLLGALADAGLPVPVPIPSATGALCASWQDRPYAVFPFVHGRRQTDADWQLAARALKQVHDIPGIDLRPATMAEPEIWQLRERLDHPWIRDRADEVADNIRRLEDVMTRAAAKNVRNVLCHRDFGGHNVLVDDGELVAILDWDAAALAPREHDVWVAAELQHAESFLTEYGARDLDLDHVEYALLARALRDMAARVLTERDRPGVDTWGFQRIARLGRDLDLFRPFCA